jgi:hypothetical protein
LPNDISSPASAQRRTPSPDDYRSGPLAPYLSGQPCLEIGEDGAVPTAASSDGGQSLVFASYRLQNIRDYRAALQGWFAAVRHGGHLVVVVPHAFLYERRNVLPSPWKPAQRRLYTPRSLIEEVEEALVPNSYRVRWLGDCDAGYDYALDRTNYPVGRHDVALVLERIVAPDWDLAPPPAPALDEPDFGFEPERTRIETASLPPAPDQILLLKLDHLGDFIVAIPAMEAIRATFPKAEITLVVGSWNEAFARDLGLADNILVFDAYPRNSAEERVDVHGKAALFEALVTGEYDLAIDLRTDPETRFLLERVRAGLRAGLGMRGQFPYLDIALPLDPELNRVEAAWQREIPSNRFSAQPFCSRTRFHIGCEPQLARQHEGALVWGPYERLVPGDYIWTPFIELEAGNPGLVAYDVAVDLERVAYGIVPPSGEIDVRFASRKRDATFEFRLWMVDEEPLPAFRFYGGRLAKQGASAVLHQSEYLLLLTELIALRVGRFGLFGERSAP